MAKRKTDADEDVAYFRASSRIFRSNDKWYFAAREGDQGPFESEEEAAKELATYIKLMDVHPERAAEEPEPMELMDKETRPNPKVWDQFDSFN